MIIGNARFPAHVFRLGLSIALLLVSTVHAQQPPETRLAIFKDAIEAVGAAGDAIIKITDGIKHLVVTGVAGYNCVAAERDHARLKDISARGINLVGMKQVVVVKSIDDYLMEPNPTSDDWEFIRQGVQNVINDVKELLDQVRTERSDFVLEEAYAKLGSSLKSRGIMLEKLARLPQPVTSEERAALAKLNVEYKRLLLNFEEAIRQLNLYLKQNKCP